MNNEISKVQLDAFTEATIKSATELEKIVSSLHIIIEKQDKIVDRIFNGMIDEIVEGVSKNYDSTHKATIASLDRIEKCAEDNRLNFPNQVEQKLQNSPWAKDIEHTKWFITIVGIIVIVATVILRGLDNRTALNNEINEFRKATANIIEVKK